VDPTKPTILIESDSSHTLHNFLKDYFNVTVYDSTKTYDKHTLVLAPIFTNHWWQDLYEHGHRIVIDNLAEPYDHFKKTYQPMAQGQYYPLHNANWFWYVEAETISTQSYTPDRSYKKLALMPMNYEKAHRTLLFDRMQPYLDDCIYSFAARGIYLPNDRQDKTPPWDRHFDAEWYNATYFTLATETWSDDIGEYQRYGPTPGNDLWAQGGQYSGPYPFITEKTYKPIAHQHPFMVYGQSHTLAQLRALGFETYGNLFDESYDHVTNADINKPDNKLDIIINNVRDFERRPYDQLTLDKIRHNYAHYTDLQLIKQRVRKEIIDPLLDYANET
jgi:hypothetical protein